MASEQPTTYSLSTILAIAIPIGTACLLAILGLVVLALRMSFVASRDRRDRRAWVAAQNGDYRRQSASSQPATSGYRYGNRRRHKGFWSTIFCLGKGESFSFRNSLQNYDHRGRRESKVNSTNGHRMNGDVYQGHSQRDDPRLSERSRVPTSRYGEVTHGIQRSPSGSRNSYGSNRGGNYIGSTPGALTSRSHPEQQHPGLNNHSGPDHSKYVEPDDHEMYSGQEMDISIPEQVYQSPHRMSHQIDSNTRYSQSRHGSHLEESRRISQQQKEQQKQAIKRYQVESSRDDRFQDIPGTRSATVPPTGETGRISESGGKNKVKSAEYRPRESDNNTFNLQWPAGLIYNDNSRIEHELLHTERSGRVPTGGTVFELQAPAPLTASLHGSLRGSLRESPISESVSTNAYTTATENDSLLLLSSPPQMPTSPPEVFTTGRISSNADASRIEQHPSFADWAAQGATGPWDHIASTPGSGSILTAPLSLRDKSVLRRNSSGLILPEIGELRVGGAAMDAKSSAWDGERGREKHKPGARSPPLGSISFANAFNLDAKPPELMSLDLSKNSATLSEPLTFPGLDDNMGDPRRASSGPSVVTEVAERYPHESVDRPSPRFEQSGHRRLQDLIRRDEGLQERSVVVPPYGHGHTSVTSYTGSVVSAGRSNHTVSVGQLAHPYPQRLSIVNLGPSTGAPLTGVSEASGSLNSLQRTPIDKTQGESSASRFSGPGPASDMASLVAQRQSLGSNLASGPTSGGPTGMMGPMGPMGAWMGPIEGSMGEFTDSGPGPIGESNDMPNRTLVVSHSNSSRTSSLGSSYGPPQPPVSTVNAGESSTPTRGGTISSIRAIASLQSNRSPQSPGYQPARPQSTSRHNASDTANQKKDRRVSTHAYGLYRGDSPTSTILNKPLPSTPVSGSESGIVTNMNGARYRAIVSYIPQLSDELELQQGDIVQVFQMFDDGWCLGRVIDNDGRYERQGICPKACLTRID